MRIEIKAINMALAAAVGVLGATFGFALVLQSTQGAPAKQELQTNPVPIKPVAASDKAAEQGHQLFDRNCAHCHGDDARGDEGPTLYNLVLSDARISKRIREGVKGEMPKFGSKFNDADIQALIAYLRTLKD